MRGTASDSSGTGGPGATSGGLHFEHPADRRFFEDLLCEQGEPLEQYALFFDFRPAAVKRAEFGRRRPELLSLLTGKYGQGCQLQLPDISDHQGDIQVDHLIPLASNKLNKELRHLAPPPGRKVAPQSFGSNNLENLVIACRKCNAHKKHRFLSSDEIRRILRARAV